MESSPPPGAHCAKRTAERRPLSEAYVELAAELERIREREAGHPLRMPRMLRNAVRTAAYRWAGVPETGRTLQGWGPVFELASLEQLRLIERFTEGAPRMGTSP